MWIKGLAAQSGVLRVGLVADRRGILGDASPSSGPGSPSGGVPAKRANGAIDLLRCGAVVVASGGSQKGGVPEFRPAGGGGGPRPAWA
eukprot:5056886-Pyramimonas_sp.AAC.1